VLHPDSLHLVEAQFFAPANHFALMGCSQPYAAGLGSASLLDVGL
jgi:hypothetical protein